MAAEAQARRGRSSYIVEYKPGTESKVTAGGSLGHIQNPNNIIEGEYLGKNLGLNDIAKVTDSKGNVVYDASKTAPKPKVELKQPTQPQKVQRVQVGKQNPSGSLPNNTTNFNEGAFSPADIANLEKKIAADNPLNKALPSATKGMSPEDLANLSPKDQMALAEKMGPQKPLAPTEVNTLKNPYKANLPQVGHNDFGQVVANEQVAGTIGKDNVLTSMDKLRKTHPEEYKNFWEYANADPGFADAPKSPELQQALDAWRISDNRIHGNSQGLGGNTNYLENHGLHPTIFNDQVTTDLINGANPKKFQGLNNFSRKHQTMADLRAAAAQHGFTVGNDPLKEAENYLNASAHSLRKRAIIKGTQEADALNLDKTHNLSLGVGQDNIVPISAQAHSALRGLQRSLPTNNPLVRGARTANVATKSTLLSFGQFHPNNISLLRAAPTLAMPKPSMAFYRNPEGKIKIDPTMGAHPVRAVQGLYDTYRPLAPGGKARVAKNLATDVNGGLDLYAARIGAPLNSQLFDSSGSSIAGVGHKLLSRQMEGMHRQAVMAIRSDLEKRGISPDSSVARDAGQSANNMMGFVNDEAQKIPPPVKRALGDWLLARQFTHSKFSQLRSAGTKGGVGGAYARANVAANVVASTAIIAGVGYIMNQKSDNIRDALIRAITDPAIPTPMKDSKGNTVKLRIPGTDASDISKTIRDKGSTTARRTSWA